MIDCTRVLNMCKEVFPKYSFEIYYTQDSWLDDDFILITQDGCTKTTCLSMYRICTQFLFKELISRSPYFDEAAYFASEGYFDQDNFVDKIYELHLNITYQ